MEAGEEEENNRGEEEGEGSGRKIEVNFRLITPPYVLGVNFCVIFSKIRTCKNGDFVAQGKITKRRERKVTRATNNTNGRRIRSHNMIIINEISKIKIT